MPPINYDANMNAVAPSGAVTVTPSDTVDLVAVSGWINCSTTGAMKVTMLDDTIVTLTLAAGYWHRMSVTRIWSAGLGAGTVVVGY